MVAKGKLVGLRLEEVGFLANSGNFWVFRLIETNQIRIIYTLDVKHLGKLNWLNAINPIPDTKMRELLDFLQG